MFRSLLVYGIITGLEKGFLYVINLLFAYTTYFKVCPTCSNRVSNVPALICPPALSISLSLAPPLVQYGFSYIISEALSVPTVLTLQKNYTWYRKGFQRWMIIWWQWMHLCDRHFNDITLSVIFSNRKIWGVKTFQRWKKYSPAIEFNCHEAVFHYE